MQSLSQNEVSVVDDVMHEKGYLLFEYFYIFSSAHMLACNIFYELEKVCTSIIAQDENGNLCCIIFYYPMAGIPTL